MYIDLDWIESIDPDTGDVVMGGGQYPVKNLNFSPQVDMTGNSMPVNEYTCDVITTDEIPVACIGHRLRDELDQSWAEWPLRKVIRVAANCWRVTASSWLSELEHTELEPRMYEEVTASAAIAECFGEYNNDYTISPSIQFKTVSGFAPAQNARERLTWLLFVLGAFPVDVFRDDVYIRAVDDTEALVPPDRTFMRPSLDTGDTVTAIRLTAYTFREGTEEEWQSDDNSFQFPTPWIATPQVFELTNPDADEDAPENAVVFDSLYLINPDNVSEIAQRLATYWFNPVEASVACVNNRQYRPGDLVLAYTDIDRMISGYVQQATFAFGKQARSTLKLAGVTKITPAKLTVRYTYQNGIIGKAVYYLPVGYTYSIDNPYIDQTVKGTRRVYRPQESAVTGTMAEGDNTATAAYDIALEYKGKRLTVYSVDGVTKQDDTGVIS